MFPQPIVMMCLAPNKSSLEVGTVRLPNGCPKLIWSYKMRVNSMANETAAYPRLSRNCLVLWLGDYRQTPGGLRKSTAARRFRQELPRRPVALMGNSEKVQPNTFFQVVVRYLAGIPLSPAYPCFCCFSRIGIVLFASL